MDYRNIKKNRRYLYWVIAGFIILVQPFMASGQQTDSLPVLQDATLQACIQYALRHNPDIQSEKLNQEITETIIKSKLADWYPQVNFSYNLQHNFQLPSLNFNGNIIHTGTNNTSGIDFSVSQNIFNRDVLLASRTANDVRLAASENTVQKKINITVAVSKAFYNLILQEQQLKVVEQDIVRTQQSVKDAYYQYQAGIVDKTDYKRATIALNNAKAQQKSTEENIKAQKDYLKSIMGYPSSKEIPVAYDTAQMEQDIYLDTLQKINYNNRIEVQYLQTQQRLQQYNLKYYKWSFLPDISAFGNYNLNFLNNQFAKLYSQSFPNSFAGITLTLPIFQGGKRLQQIRQAQLQIAQVNNDILSLENSINSEYSSALASYKSNLYNFLSLKENLSLASEVYDVIRLQYRSGVKAYLDVITAESDLRTAQINYYNALYQLLASKIDVAQALGTITY